MSDRQTRNLLCYASGHGHDWEAICLDLDIAVQGQSFDEVFNDLNEAIALYLESVRELPEAERARLMGLEPAKAGVMVAGALIVLTILQVGGQDSLVVIDAGLLEGILQDLAGKF